MGATPLPLARRLGALDVLDAAVWFARDHLATWALTACAGGLAFAASFTAFLEFCLQRPGGSALGSSAIPLLAGSAVLAAVWIARGLGHWAALEHLRSVLDGAPLPPETCWRRALARAVPAIFHAGAFSGAQWLGMALLVVPGLGVIRARGLAAAAAVFEGLGEERAMKRAGHLASKSTLPIGVWGALLLVWVLLFLNVLLAGAIFPELVRLFTGLSFPRIERALSPQNGLFVTLAAVGSWAACDGLRVSAFGVLYLNARTEREGGDLLDRIRGVAEAGRP